MQSFDITIIGGGIVGLSLAARLAETGSNADVSIAIVEGSEIRAPNNLIPARVSAISSASKTILEALNVWQNIDQTKITPYNKMQVWDKDSFGKLSFDTAQIEENELGYIIENDRLQHALFEIVKKQKNVTIFSKNKLKSVSTGNDGAWLTLQCGQNIMSKLVVGADGAHSSLRSMSDIPLTYWDYNHHAIVATIKTELPHNACARQIFTKEGPLAFLPLYEENLCSIVWSVSPERATHLMASSTNEFNKILSREFDNQLGWCEAQNTPMSFPLTMRYARDFAQHRIALIGDAAHTIHPLAGQGVNLGLLDAMSLAQVIIKNKLEDNDIGDYKNLRYFERWRKTEAMQMIAAMELLKRLFEGSHPVKKLVRDLALIFTDKAEPLKQVFIKQAMGLKGELPEIVSKKHQL